LSENKNSFGMISLREKKMKLMRAHAILTNIKKVNDKKTLDFMLEQLKKICEI
jgi:hypothetical protein